MPEHETSDFRLVISIDFRRTNLRAWQNGDIVWESRLTPGGIDFIMDLMDYLKSNKKFLIGRIFAESVILSFCSTISIPKDQIIRGRDLNTGGIGELHISSEQLYEALDRRLKALIFHLKSSLFPEKYSNMQDPPQFPHALLALLPLKSILLTGEFGSLHGLDRLLEDALNLKVVVEMASGREDL